MSWTKTSQDSGAYTKKLYQSADSLEYLLDDNKFYNKNKCRVDFGIVAGNNVSLPKSNLVDLESHLRGQYHLNTRDPDKKYNPDEYINQHSIKNKTHLKSCKIVDYNKKKFENYSNYNAKQHETFRRNSRLRQDPPEMNPMKWI
jgi:hypothetical protein